MTQHDNNSQSGAVAVYTPQPAALAPSQTNETSATVLATRVRAEVEARTLVAINRPRNVDAFRLRILAACERPVFAEAAQYAKPIGGTTITGLSIRFAEECVRHFSNRDISSFAVSEDDDRRVIKVVAVDLESNNSFSLDVIVTKTVERKKTQRGDDVIRQRLNKKGETLFVLRADDDALLVKQNALIAKAQREVILKHIPSDVKEEAQAAVARVVADRDAKDPEESRRALLTAFYGVGVMPEQLVEFLGHPLETTSPAELGVLRKVYRGMTEEETTWSDVMATKKAPAGSAAGATAAPGAGAGERLRSRVGKKADPAEEGATPAGATAAAAPSAESVPAPDPAGNTCQKCGGLNGKHDGECPDFADED